MQNNSAIVGNLVPFPKLLPANENKNPASSSPLFTDAGVPDYLSRHYWWAYVHPQAVRLFERDWLVNLILWGSSATGW
jgi:hypothetical protein